MERAFSFLRLGPCRESGCSPGGRATQHGNACSRSFSTPERVSGSLVSTQELRARIVVIHHGEEHVTIQCDLELGHLGGVLLDLCLGLDLLGKVALLQQRPRALLGRLLLDTLLLLLGLLDELERVHPLLVLDGALLRAAEGHLLLERLHLRGGERPLMFTSRLLVRLELGLVLLDVLPPPLLVDTLLLARLLADRILVGVLVGEDARLELRNRAQNAC
eukprot:6205140-Pleurochrysis_carterae.AAC.2